MEMILNEYHKKHIKSLAFLLLLLFTITAAAQDAVIRRGCRVGTPRPEGMALRRGAPTGVTKRTGGDFYHGERHQLTVMVEFNDRASRLFLCAKLWQLRPDLRLGLCQGERRCREVCQQY